jgi:hypothetical protein
MIRPRKMMQIQGKEQKHTPTKYDCEPYFSCHVEQCKLKFVADAFKKEDKQMSKKE